MEFTFFMVIVFSLVFLLIRLCQGRGVAPSSSPNHWSSLKRIFILLEGFITDAGALVNVSFVENVHYVSANVGMLKAVLFMFGCLFLILIASRIYINFATKLNKNK